jgi:hypothetical protein
LHIGGNTPPAAQIVNYKNLLARQGTTSPTAVTPHLAVTHRDLITELVPEPITLASDI